MTHKLPAATGREPGRPDLARLRSVLRVILEGETASGKLFYPNELAFRRVSARVLAFAMLGLLCLAALLAWFEGSHGLLPILLAVLPVPAAALVWLRLRPQAALRPLFLLTGSLMLMGACLLRIHGAPQWSSLAWFSVFPPMAMVCLGLRYGTIVVAGFLAFLALLMLTPLSAFLADPLPLTIRLRFLLIVLGAFVFSWCAEYIRSNTSKALVRMALRLEQEALTDPLTGLGNRRDFHNFFSWAAAGSARDGKPFSLVMVDIDFFKRVSDTHGHATGDKVLIHMTRLLGACIRGSDRIFRWGGEEFVILMPGLTAAAARRAAERMRARVEATPYKEGRLVLSYTVSAGLSSGCGSRGLPEMVAEADDNLYRAKSLGRNLVVGGEREQAL